LHGNACRNQSVGSGLCCADRERTGWCGEALRILVDEASKIERSHLLRAEPYERTVNRRDYANGFKPKTVLTRVGELTFQVPQVRSGDFYLSALEKGTRTDQAVNLALAEMVVQGVSTRRVIEVLQRLLGPEISLSTAQVSRAAATLRAIFNVPDRVEAERLLMSALEAWRKEHPKLAEWAEEAIPEGLTVFDFPAAHRVRQRTTNGLEGINRELRRRTRCLHLPQPRFLPASDFGLARRTRRRVRPTRSISTSTRKPNVMTATAEIYRKGVVQSRRSGFTATAHDLAN
jgi:transposase-like protein